MINIISICKKRDRLYLELAWFTILNPLLQHRYNTVNSSPCQNCNTIPYHPIKSPSFVKRRSFSILHENMQFKCTTSQPWKYEELPKRNIGWGSFQTLQQIAISNNHLRMHIEIYLSSIHTPFNILVSTNVNLWGISQLVKKAKLAFLCFCSKVSRKRERKQEEPFLSDRGNKWKVKTVRVGIFRWERVGLRSKNLKYVRQENQRGWKWLFSLLSSTYSHHSQFQSFHSLNYQDIGRKSTLKINISAFFRSVGVSRLSVRKKNLLHCTAL